MTSHTKPLKTLKPIAAAPFLKIPKAAFKKTSTPIRQQVLVAAVLIATILGGQYAIKVAHPNETAEPLVNAYQVSYEAELQHDWARAISVLKPIGVESPQDYALNLRLGYLFAQKGNLEISKTHYERAAKNQKDAIDPLLGLLSLLSLQAVQGNESEKEALAQKIMDIDFYHYQANLALAESLSIQGKYEQSLPIYQKMLKLFPSDVTWMSAYAQALHFSGDVQQAQALADQVLVLQSQNAAALVVKNNGTATATDQAGAVK